MAVRCAATLSGNGSSPLSIDRLSFGLKALVDDDVGSNDIRRIQPEAHRYVLGDSSAEARPFYRENNGEPAGCILEADVVTALGRTHDNQGHWNYNQQRCQ
jgi:hypothetical protein